MRANILIIDDEPGTIFGFTKYLANAGYEIKSASCLKDAREVLNSGRFDVIILDLILPDGNGADWISDIRETHPDIAIIVISGQGDIPCAVESMRRGADNFLTKPVSLSDLDVFLRKSLELGALRRKDLTRQRMAERNQPYFGDSPLMKKVMEMVAIATKSDSAVLLQGETGSGKGVMARWIYEHGIRKNGPFVEINCSGLKGDLLASELFGHTKGAFTSAVQDRQGLIEVADGGTLFLDEIGDMDIEVQAQFLKVIEEKQYRRLGDVRTRKSDFRLIAATNRDLLDETRKGNFRKDLFFRINVFPITIPPLQKRPGDIPGLINHFLAEFRTGTHEFPPDVLGLLQRHPWPGNIRELRNILERAILLSRGGPLNAGHFPDLHEPLTEKTHDLKQLEAHYLETLLEQSGRDIMKAAKKAGISRSTFYRKIKELKQ